MRVLIVSQYFWPENFRINALVESLVEKGIQVEVLTGKPNYPEGVIANGYKACGTKTEVWEGALIHRVPLIPRGRNSPARLILNYFSFIIFGTLSGISLLRRNRFDAVFVYCPSPILSAIPALLIGWLKKSPVIIWVQDLWPESLSATGYVKNGFVLGAVRQVVKLIYKHAKLILVQSHAFIEPVKILAPFTPIQYYPNSVDESFALPANTPPPSVAGLEQGFSVMFAGNIGAAQAVDVIVGAANILKEYKDIHFVVLGDGSSRNDMLKAVHDLGLNNLHLPGRFPVETMPSFMQKASALLVTLADRPIFAATVPNKVQAYLASGKPIIACLNGEGAKIVTAASAGIATPAEDASALSKAILELYNLTPEERSQMGNNGLRYYHEHFEHEKLVHQLIQILENTANNAKDSQ